VVVPAVQALELAVVEGLEVRRLAHLGAFMQPPDAATPEAPAPGPASMGARTAEPSVPLDLADVKGQWHARRALVIAAAGGHSLLMSGPPGSGKSMLARRLPGLLPPLTREESLQVAAIAAVAQLPLRMPLARPFRSPHHTTSAHAIDGGGSVVRPGEVSLAHHGVLFLDELPEFDRRVLEGLREPLEAGVVHVVRANQRAEFPASFQLVAAMNPCPCGRAGLAAPKCRCRPEQLERYRARISGPLLDRIDIQLQLPQVDIDALSGTEASGAPVSMNTATAVRIVCAARERQHRRQGRLNSQLGPEDTLRCCNAGAEGLQLLRAAARNRGLSARSQHRVLRVARSIADMEGRDPLQTDDVAEALAMRWPD
jgi:magnesium chelatase family protein